MTKLPSLTSSIPSASLSSSSSSHSFKKPKKPLNQSEELNEIKQFLYSIKRFHQKNSLQLIPSSQIHQSDLCYDDWEAWAMKHGKKLSSKYSMNEIRQLRQWFHELDNDQSGEVSYNELIDPLLSSGIMKSKEDIQHLIQILDTDGSGEINFNEFLNLLKNEKFCVKKNIKVLQNITRPSAIGLSTAMKLSQERRKHLLATVIDQTIKRQQEMDQLYLLHSPHSHPSHHSSHSSQSHHQHPLQTPLSQSPSPVHVKHSHPISSCSQQQRSKKKRPKLEEGKVFESKLEKVALSHHKQVMRSSQYIHSLEPIVSSHKLTIAADNVVDTTVTRDIYDTSVHTVMGDPELDIGYKDGLEGRRESLRRLDYVNHTKFGQGTSLNLKRLEEEDEGDDYAQYDSQVSIYAPKEVVEKIPPPSHKHHQSHSSASVAPLHRSSSKNMSSSHRLVPKLSPIVSGHSNPPFSFPSQRFTKSNLHPPGDEEILETCRSGRITLRRQPSLSSRIQDGESQSIAHLSPITTGRRRILAKSHSKSARRQIFSHHSPGDPTDAPHVAAVEPKRRSSVVKRFYRKESAVEGAEEGNITEG